MGALIRLLRLARPETRRLGAGLVFLILSSAATLALPKVVQGLLDEGLGQESMGTVYRTAAWVFGLLTVQSLAGGARFYLFTLAGERIVADLRTQLFDRFSQEPIAFFDRHRTGELLSRLSSDAQLIQNAVSVNVSMVLRSVASAVGAVALLFTISVKLTLVMLAVVPPIAIGAVAFGRLVRRRSAQAQDALARAGEVAEETLGAIRTIRAFSAEERASAHYKRRVDGAFDAARHRIRASSIFFVSATMVGFTAMIGVLLLGAQMNVQGALSGGELTAFVLYTLMLSVSLGSLAELWSDFMRATGATLRVFAYLDAPAPPTGLGWVPERRSEGHIVFDGVDFGYPSRKGHVLRGIELEVAPTKTVALVGPSGAGKSTIVSLLFRFYDPVEGQIRLDGQDLRDYDIRWLRDQMGLVAQEPVLFSTTIAENIRFGRPGATQADIERAARDAYAHDFVLGLPDGYHTEVGERGVQLSGGQRQRLAIARALLADPPILVLDEATSALDAEAEAEVKQALDRLQQGRTLIVIAHRLSTVRDADEVVVLEQGQVVEQGAHQELMSADGLYRRLVAHQLS
ncbi:MAG: ABC transporter transmembrane domain-containing protein [Myxococcota bacterium]